MSNFVLASAPAPPPPPLPVWQGLQHRWDGWNGWSFNLDVESAGVVLLADGATGMHLPEFDQYVDESASVPGGRYRGSRARTRNPEWTLGVFGDTSEVWRARDAAFWGTMRPDKVGVWTVTLPSGERRSLRCRYRSSSEFSYVRDPHEAGWAIYQVTLMAEQPFWEGPEILSPTWGTSEDSLDFTGEDDEAPPYWISGATSLGSASLHNPGDVDGYLTWTIKGGDSGGLTSGTIAADGGTLEFGAVGEGETLVIDTDPTRPVALLDGVDVTGSLDVWDPRPLPAGVTSDLSISLVGNGTIRASFTPRYLRAW